MDGTSCTNAQVKQSLERLRERLLDFTNRNRLLNFQDNGAKIIKIIDELPDQVFNVLVRQNKPMFFEPIESEDAELEGKAGLPSSPSLRGTSRSNNRPILEAAVRAVRMAEEADRAEAVADASQTADELPEVPENGSSSKRHHTDNLLQTSLTLEQLEGRIRRIYSDFQDYIESTGSNFLFLAFGFLEWFDPDAEPDKARLAPLLLLPVKLTRELVTMPVEENADPNESRPKRRMVRQYRYAVRYSGEDILTNITLDLTLKRRFNLCLPKVEEEELAGPEEYIQEVKQSLSNWKIPSKKPWKIARRIRLGFFTFGKDVMYRDLDPENWPKGGLLENEIVRMVLAGGKRAELMRISEADVEKHHRDCVIPTVVDADASQMKVLIKAETGRNLIVQGPPGTGKSQTITNLIAAALAKGKKVLFVAEKLAALEVVKSRLEKVGLGPFCLELHSRHAGAKEVHAQIRRRLNHRRSVFTPAKLKEEVQKLNAGRKVLNDHCEIMGRNLPELQCTVSDLLWRAEAARNRLRRLVSAGGRSTGHFQVPSLRKRKSGSPVALCDFDTLLRTLDALRQHWEEGIHERGKVWSGFSGRRLTQEDVYDIERILRESTNALREFEAARRSCFGAVDTSHLSVRSFFDLRSHFQHTKAPARAWWVQVVAENLASGVVNAAEYRKFVEDVSFIRERVQTLPYRLASNDSITPSQMELARSVLDRLSTFKTATFRSLAETEDFLAKAEQARNALRGIQQALARIFGFLGPISFKPATLETARAVRDWCEWLITISTRHLAALEELHVAPAVEHHLKLALEKAEKLATLREHLDRLYVVQDAPSEEDLRALRLELREAASSWLGYLPFGRLARAKQSAKRFARLGVAVTSPEFVEELEELGKYPSRVADFAGSPELKEHLGSLFRGCETDWDQLKECVGIGRQLVRLSGTADSAASLVGRLKAGTAWQHDLKSALQAFAFSEETFLSLAKDLFPDPEAMVQWPFRDLEESLDEKLREASAVCEGVRPLGVEPGTDFSEFRIAEAIELRERKARAMAFLSDEVRLKDHAQGLFDTDLDAITSTVEWCEPWLSVAPPLREVAAWVLASDTPRRFAEFDAALSSVINLLDQWRSSAARLAHYGTVDPNSCFSSVPCDHTAAHLIEALEKAVSAVDILLRWIDYQVLFHWVQENGYASILNYAVDHHLPGRELKLIAEAAFHSDWLEFVIGKHPEVWDFRRVEHETTRRHFIEKDRNLPTLFQCAVEDRVYVDPASVDHGVGHGRASEYTEMSLIQRELKKQIAHIPVRELVRRAKGALLKLMPCWMMGPASVAQFLPQGEVQFDLLIMDEASQIRPEEALGSFARCKQAVIVGDSNQMPPTDVFTSLIGDDDGASSPAEDLKSILDHLDSYFDSERLRWHYRSQHESLIRFSNVKYYDRELVIPPSVYRHHPDLGIKWHFVEGAKYHAGLNEIEAEEIIRHLRDHVLRNAKERPERQESIGIVTMNQKQQMLIQELLERHLSDDPIFATAWERFKPTDGLFVKNLENVQGDERDVIFIGFTYGPDSETGRVYQRFGPIAGEGGWRRLNVLFTRAKKRIHAFSSMRYQDVRPTDSFNKRGIADLRGYLEFAETGKMPDLGFPSGRGPDSAFEESVAEVLQSLGHTPHFQVGVDGFYIDIGVVDPHAPGRYLCGIECDGATYHSHPVARDRDRLREEILISRGWTIHRIWSTDWYKNRRTEIDRLEALLKKLVEQSRGAGKEIEIGGLS